MGGAVAEIKRGERELPAALQGCDVHGERFVREAQAQQKTLPARQACQPGGFGGGHQQIAQIDDEHRRDDRQDARARAPEAGEDELAGAGKHQHGHGHGQGRGNIVFDRQHAEGEAHRHIAQHDGQGAPQAFRHRGDGGRTRHRRNLTVEWKQ